MTPACSCEVPEVVGFRVVVEPPLAAASHHLPQRAVVGHRPTATVGWRPLATRRSAVDDPSRVSKPKRISVANRRAYCLLDKPDLVGVRLALAGNPTYIARRDPDGS